MLMALSNLDLSFLFIVSLGHLVLPFDCQVFNQSDLVI